MPFTKTCGIDEILDENSGILFLFTRFYSCYGLALDTGQVMILTPFGGPYSSPATRLKGSTHSVGMEDQLALAISDWIDTKLGEDEHLR